MTGSRLASGSREPEPEAPEAPGAIRAQGLGFTYAGAARPALRGLDLEVPAGSCLLVVGPSGSGKSTLALALAGLVPRDIPGAWQGSLTVDGRETRSFDPGALADRVGLVFQDPSRQIVMDRVEDDVAFGLENRGWPRDAMLRRTPEALAAVGLAGTGRRPARELSGGQQQRLALAGVLAPTPSILVLDEPTANLDPPGAAAFADRIASLRAARSATIVLVEHRVELAWPLADLVLALGADGAPIDVGPADEVLRRSRSHLAAAGIWLPADGSAARTGASPARAGASRGGTGSSPAPAPGGAEVVRATDVAYGYERGVPVLRDLDLVARSGERIALVGPNGSGKSTLGRLLVGLLRPDAGSVTLGGSDPTRLAPAALSHRAGYVFQEPERQFLAASVRQEVLLGLRPDEVPGADAVMERLGMPLATFGDRSPYRLSGGEQRRLSLATALVRRPALLVLDEPTFGQDRHGFDALVTILRERVDAATCVVMATHDERFVREAADRVIRLEGGAIVSDGPGPASVSPASAAWPVEAEASSAPGAGIR